MRCIAPDEISEEQLLAYADGEANSGTLDHVRRCPACAERARTFATHQLVLRRLFQRLACPDPHILGEYRLGLLSSTERAAVEDHLQVCSSCAAEADNLEDFFQAVAITPTVSTLPAQLKRIIARPVSISSPGALQAGFALRGTATAAPGVYRAEDIKLVVGLEADGLRAGYKVLLGFTSREGQPLGDLTAARVLLKRDGVPFAVEEVDALGNFVFSDLGSGEYELVLFTDREQVVVETLVI
jgi:anti-sigma factor ChrR (cupin superfamily)